MKRFLPTFLAIIAMLSMCSGMACAIEYGVYSSYTLHSYNARLRAGATKGTVNISFDVRSSKMADSIGVSSIVIYTSNGDYVDTITGSTDNGLIREDSSIHAASYPCTLTSGTSYYAEVTVFATVGRTSDDRVVTTNIVTAP